MYGQKIVATIKPYIASVLFLMDIARNRPDILDQHKSLMTAMLEVPPVDESKVLNWRYRGTGLTCN